MESILHLFKQQNSTYLRYHKNQRFLGCQKSAIFYKWLSSTTIHYVEFVDLEIK